MAPSRRRGDGKEQRFGDWDAGMADLMGSEANSVETVWSHHVTSNLFFVFELSCSAQWQVGSFFVCSGRHFWNHFR